MFIWGACKDAPPVETDDYLSPAKQAPVQDQERQIIICLYNYFDQIGLLILQIPDHFFAPGFNQIKSLIKQVGIIRVGYFFIA